MKARRRFVLLAALILLTPHVGAFGGRVVDEASGQPLAGAIVTHGTEVAIADQKGRYSLTGSGSTVAARAIGYRRGAVTLTQGAREAPPLHLRSEERRVGKECRL